LEGGKARRYQENGREAESEHMICSLYSTG
jgi:hypothetical protein